MSSNALVFMANDHYYRWAVTFLESVREQTADLPLYWIPYDDDVARVRSLRSAFRFEQVDVDLNALDAFANRLFPSLPKRRANLRKYVALGLPCDEVAYFDIDTMVLVNPARLFGHVKAGTLDLVYLSTSPGFVYRKDRMTEARSHFPNMPELSAGAFITSRHSLSVAEIIDTVEGHRELYQSLRRRGQLYDQPLLNFVLDRAGKICRHIRDLDPSLCGMVHFRNPDISFENGRLVETASGRDVAAIHWSGTFKLGLEMLNPRLWRIGRLRAGFLKRGKLAGAAA